MATRKPLKYTQLSHQCDPKQLPFKDTNQLEELTDVIGQERAIESIQFGLGIEHKGFNLYVMGPSGMGKHSIVKRYLATLAPVKPKPDAWCYINNFKHRYKPRAIRLPHDVAVAFREDMDDFATEVGKVLPSLFEGERYQESIEKIEMEMHTAQESAFSEVAKHAGTKGVTLFRTPSGYAFAPVIDDKVLSPEQFADLPSKQQEQIEQVIDELQTELQETLQQIPHIRKETREKVKQLQQAIATQAVTQLLQPIRSSYHDFEAIAGYLDEVEKDVVEHIAEFIDDDDDADNEEKNKKRVINRYKVNHLPLFQNGDKGAPVVYVDNPTYMNLIGKVEYLSHMGNLVTDFTLLKPGALHQANGGYLLLDAHKLLSNPYAWEGLKRALNSGKIKIESPDQMLNMNTTISLEPEPIPLNIKIIMLGDRHLYYHLHEVDPEFSELFRVQVDFEEELERNDENIMLLARLIGSVVRKENLLPVERSGIAAVIDYASRRIEHAEKISIHMRSIADLIREADYHTRQIAGKKITHEAIRQAIQQQIYRASRVQEHLDDALVKRDTNIDTEGEKIGQINALTVLETGDYSFGQPARVTATVSLGDGTVVDIERETDLSGAIHTKGVLILSAFLTARYARMMPLALNASIVFEQSYGEVDGDSASMAELCAILSAIAEIPIRQNMAITGSMDQFGEAQPIGGVNEKIEGFYRLCKRRGITKHQGVIIPCSNVKNLMLQPEVVDAVKKGDFFVYAVKNIDEAMELLTGLPAGKKDNHGVYPAKSFNGKIQRELIRLNRLKQLANGFEQENVQNMKTKR